MKTEIPDADIGVIVGRFQTPELTDGHRELLDFVTSRHKQVIVFLGATRGVFGSTRNPLDFFTRQMMIREAYPNVTVQVHYDMRSNEDWSKSLDHKIKEFACPEMYTVRLYGSRDSFIPAYSGEFDTTELNPSYQVSATQIREAVRGEVRGSADFRVGCMYGAGNRYAVGYPVADVAVIRHTDDGPQILLGQKYSDKGKYRLFGGFFNPAQDHDLYATAQREVREETGGASCDSFELIGHTRIDDWRYRGSQDCVLSNLFVCYYQFGPSSGGDDIDATMWHDVDAEVFDRVLVDEHQGLGRMVLDHLI